jgi:NAD-dependent deacetylase
VMESASQAVATADVVLVVGTSAVVYPVAALPQVARRSGARLVEVNVEETALSPFVDAALRGLAGEVLPELERRL